MKPLDTCDAVRFETLEEPSQPFANEPPELDWLDAALRGPPRAVLWRATQGLVMPMSYRRYAALEAASAGSAARGWPVRLRRSGGGVVPQGPGILNLSLVYAIDGHRGIRPEAAYRVLCAVLRRALLALDIEADVSDVPASFCDGRFNLAVAGRKICGTAQYWRRLGTYQAVLAHALLLVDVDTEAVTAAANAFEEALASGRRYSADVLTTVTDEWRGGESSGTLERLLRASIAESLGPED